MAAGSFDITRRVQKFIYNHYDDDPDVLISEIFAEIKQENFRKSIELDIRPGTFGDVYLVNYDCEDWYVKFYIEDDMAVVQILSCNWDGCLH